MTLDQLQSILPERYRLIREIGRGGMAVVYLADDTVEQRQVAIKVLTGELGSSLDVTRFEREIRIAAELSHPNILSAYDSGSADGTLFYVMPFVEGRSVRERLEEERQLPVADAIRITKEACDALALAHARGIVHRDIKPENILLQNGHAIVADFGIARLIAEQGATLTQTGLSLGTAQYMSPEQASAEKVDARTDVYSLGCVLYEMLVGEPPFTGPNAMAVLARSVAQPVPSIRVVRPGVPETVEYVVMRALEKTPADRFASVNELKEALVAAESSATMTREQRAYTESYRSGGQRPVPKARRWMVPAFAAGAALAALGLWIGTRRHAAAADADANRIAVMYFEDGTKDHSLSYIADGLTESLIGELGRVQGLHVVSRNAVRPFRGAAFASDSVRRALNVGTIVRGEIEPGAKLPSVTVRLVEAASGSEIKRATFDFDTTNVAASENAATQRVAEFLRTQVGLDVQLQESRLHASNPQSWIQYQRAEKQLKDADSLIAVRVPAQALAVLDSADGAAARAAALDAKWAEPLIARGNIALRRARARRDHPELASAAIDSGRAFAGRALAIDPRSADAHELNGNLALAPIELRTLPQGAEWEASLDRSEKELTAAVELNPRQASAYETLSNVYYAKKQVPEALLAASNAYAADAYLLNARGILSRLFWGYYDTENFPEARQWCDKGHKRFPGAIPFVQCSMYLMMAKGGTPDPARAWKMADTIHALAPATTVAYEDHLARTLVGGVLGKAGLLDSANHVLVAARADRTIDPSQEIIGREIMMRLMYGDFDTAIARLGDYLVIHPDHRKGLANQTAWYWRDPKVQNDPRFKRLIAGAQ